MEINWELLKHLLVMALCFVLFYIYFEFANSSKKQRMVIIAVNEYRNLLQAIELWNDYSNVFWIESRMEHFKEYSINILDEQTYNRYCEKLDFEFTTKSVKLLGWEKQISEIVGGNRDATGSL